MSIKNSCLSILLTCFFVMGLVGNSFAKKNACGKEMTAEEMAERALDLQEIQNVMSYHALYGAPGGDHDKEIELIWAHKTPDVSFAGNNYVYRGDIDVQKNTYGSGTGTKQDADTQSKNQMMQQVAPGNTSFRTLTTPIIVVAGDGKTAKAFWYTIGWSADIRNGQGNSSWSMEKYGIDFVKEDGAWKIWHFHVYNDWDVPMGKDLAQYAIEQSKNPREMPARGAREGMEKYYTSKIFNKSYSVTRLPNPLNPRPPVPYCTFKDTFSYADE